MSSCTRLMKCERTDARRRQATACSISFIHNFLFFERAWIRLLFKFLNLQLKALGLERTDDVLRDPLRSPPPTPFTSAAS